MTGRALIVTGFALGLLLSASQACVAPFECIYLYSKRPKLCAQLEPVPAVGGGFITDSDMGSPLGCSCLSVADRAQFMMDRFDPSLDPLWDAVEADARATCEQLALDAGKDPSPCATATIDKASGSTTDETFDECKELVGTIDEDRDGNCPLPGESGETGETGEETGDETTDGGSSPIPDLGVGMP